MRRRLRAFEWFFLLFGLAALDIFVWVNTNQVLYQAYQDWAFDETMRGLQPSIRGFVADEIYWMFGGTRGRPMNPPEAPEHVEVTPPPSGKPAAPPAPSSVIGRLQIPRLHVAVMVREGADERTLSRAVGHIPGTALPGWNGNVALAGHRDTFFRPLRGIRNHDMIQIETTHGTYHYVVESTKIVSPRDVEVLAASNSPKLTLVTCYPFYYVGSAPKRFVVEAALAEPNGQPGAPRGS